MHAVIPYVIAALLAAVGLYGVTIRRNAVLLLMAVELLLASATLIFVTADATRVGPAPTGQVFALFIIVLAAAELGVGLAIVLRLFRARRTVDVTAVDRAESVTDSETDEPLADLATGESSAVVVE